MNHQLARLACITMFGSLVGCQGVEAPEGEDPLAGDEVVSSDEGSSEEELGQADQSLCAWNLVSPPSSDDSIIFPSGEPGVYQGGAADGGCDPFVNSVTRDSSSTKFKRIKMETGIMGACSQIQSHMRRFWYYESGVGWNAFSGTMSMIDTTKPGPFGIQIPVCDIVATSPNFLSNNNYLQVRGALWLEDFEPEILVTTYVW